MADAPRDEGVEPSVLDAGRLRRMEKAATDHGISWYMVVARSDLDGELVAVSRMCTDPAGPGWGIQQDTAVRPETAVIGSACS
jgi:hypothetical protein